MASALKMFYNAMNKAELKVFTALKSPVAVQTFLDRIPYRSTPRYLSPLTVLKEGHGCCFEGAVFGAAALRAIGYPPLILEITAERDDEHLIAIYRRDGRWGSVAKSNYAGLRGREPVYKTLPELVLSYFEFYFNIHRERTLRGYTLPLHLAKYDNSRWMTNDSKLHLIAKGLDDHRHITLFNRKMIKDFSLVDLLTFKAGMHGTDLNHVYRPR